MPGGAANPNEQNRLAALQRYDVLDTPPEEAFDRIVDLATIIFDVPIALVSLVDRERQWFKACYGLDVRETSREVSFCAHAILSDKVMVVPDAAQDPRFRDNALVTGGPGIRFYAGAPLRTADGHNLGSLCIIDTKPRAAFTAAQQSILAGLAAQVVDELELRLAAERLRQERDLTRQLKTDLDSFFSLSVDLFCIADPDGTFSHANPAWEQVLGIDAEALTSRPFLDFVHPDDREATLETFQRLPEVTRLGGFENRYRTKDGSYRDLRWSASFDPQSERVYAVARDVTERKKTEAALAESEARYRVVAESASDAIVTVDEAGIISYANEAATRIFGYAREALLGAPLTQLMPEQMRHAHEAGFSRYQQTRQRHMDWRATEVPGRHQSGTLVPLEVSFGEHVTNGRRHFTGIMRDVSARKRAEDELRRTTLRLETTLESISDVFFSFDPEWHFTYINAHAEAFLGRPRAALLQTNIWTAFPEMTDYLFCRKCHEAVSGRQPVTFEEYYPPSDSWFEVNLYPAADGLSVYLRDVSLRKRAEETQLEMQQKLERRVETRTAELKRLNDQLQHDAFHDALTGLANRALLMDRLEQAMQRQRRRPEGGYAVLFLDFDRFKLVNDSLGHSVGDALLQALAQRLVDCVRPGDTVARLGGDEFTILLENTGSLEEATRTAERVHFELTRPFEVAGHTLHTSASLGIVSSEVGHDSAEAVVRDADLAMYRAKALGKARYQVFTPEMRARAVNLISLESDLRRAVERDELRVFYQPIVSVATERTTGFEALLRWQHPAHGLVSPAEFIPIAEETGLIVDLDRWVLKEACRQVRAWQTALDQPLAVSVNFSGRQFSDPDLAGYVRAVLVKEAFDAGSLKLEITESTLMQQVDTTVETLRQFKALGVQVYIDDFGTGYSSLSYLQRFSVNVLKIDRAFVSQMLRSAESKALIETILAMASNLNLEVVAEGIETEEQLRQLSALGCQYGQGYLFAKPLSADEVPGYFEAGAPVGGVSGTVRRAVAPSGVD